MAKGLVSQERTRGHQVWFFVKEAASNESTQKENCAREIMKRGIGRD